MWPASSLRAAAAQVLPVTSSDSDNSQAKPLMPASGMHSAAFCSLHKLVKARAATACPALGFSSGGIACPCHTHSTISLFPADMQTAVGNDGLDAMPGVM